MRGVCNARSCCLQHLPRPELAQTRMSTGKNPATHLPLLAQPQCQGKCGNTVSYHGGGLDGGLFGGGEPGGMGGFGGAGGGTGTAAGQTPWLPALG